MASLGDFRGEFGKFGMWASVGYKRHPTDFCRAFCFSNPAGFQAGPTFPTIPTFPYFLLCSYFSLLFCENALLSLLFVKNKNIYVKKGENSVFNKALLMLGRDVST